MNTRSRHASTTQTQTQEESTSAKKNLVLKLKQEIEKPSIKWTEDTVDNEHLGRKSSKRKDKLQILKTVDVLDRF